MTSWGQAITQPAQPVHSPEVITSSYSSFHWKVQRVLAGLASGSVTVSVIVPNP